MGNPRKPTALKLVTGSFRADRHNPNEPAPKPGKPKAPAHLSSAARKAWPKFTTMLDKLGVLTVADAAAMESLCEVYATLVAARAVLARDGFTYESMKERGGGMIIRQRPEVQIAQEADRALRAWLGEFGLTPAARGKVSGAAVEEANEFSDF